MNPELEKELIEEIRLEDLPENARVLAELIGIKAAVKLSKFAVGNEIYVPKLETMIREARNRRILTEYNGCNLKKVASKYKINTDTVRKILRRGKSGSETEQRK